MIGDQIKKYREGRCLSQGQLAKIVGISRPTLSKIETNKGVIDTETLMSLANALQVDWRLLVAGDLVETDVLLGDSVERINQATKQIKQETERLKEIRMDYLDSDVEFRMKRHRNILIISFSMLIVLEIVLLLIYQLANR